MNSICRAAAILLFGFMALKPDCEAETLVLGTNDPIAFSLSIPADTAMMMTAQNYPFGLAKNTITNVWWDLTDGTNTLIVEYKDWEEAFENVDNREHIWLVAGPMTIELQGDSFSSPFMFSYRRLPIAGAHTALLSPSNPTHLVSLEAGERLLPLSVPYNTTAFVTVEGKTAEVRYFDEGLDGPADVTFTNAGSFSFVDKRVVTYAVVSNSVTVTVSGNLSIDGAGVLSIENSSDGTNWTPAAIILNDGSPQTLYRLKASN